MRDKSRGRVPLMGLIGLLVLGGCTPGMVGTPSEVGNRTAAKSSTVGFSPVLEEAVADTSRMIEYRTLRREDFQGGRPPDEFVHHAPFFGAVTCVYLRVEPDLRVFSRPAEEVDGVEYVVDLERVVFRALVDRKCSWWNRMVQGMSPQRVLQHEQIHFALFEIAARRLNARMLALREQKQFRAGSVQGAKRAARRFIDRLMRDAMEELDGRNTQFDREVARGNSWEWEQQQSWWRQVEAELLETAPYAAAEFMIH